jgi:hypothetical protein
MSRTQGARRAFSVDPDEPFLAFDQMRLRLAGIVGDVVEGPDPDPRKEPGKHVPDELG